MEMTWILLLLLCTKCWREAGSFTVEPNAFRPPLFHYKLVAAVRLPFAWPGSKFWPSWHTPIKRLLSPCK
eukprot:scaffold219252_cov31-Attheya_sp.AAC.1